MTIKEDAPKRLHINRSGLNGNGKDAVRLNGHEVFARRFSEYLDAISRPDLVEVITPERPFVYLSMEFYGNGIQGGGGLGMLASDTFEIAKKTGVPMVFATPFYPFENSQSIEGFRQRLDFRRVSPEDRGFRRLGQVSISTKYDEVVALDVHEIKAGNVTHLTISEPSFRELYADGNNSDHRLYQQTAFGFGVHKVFEEMGISPSAYQINEGSAVFAALAYVDKMVKKFGLERGLEIAKENIVYTNHALVPAADNEYTDEQFEAFVKPNIGQEKWAWIENMLITGRDGRRRIRLGPLATEISSERNAVSLKHAEEASKRFYDHRGNLVEFKGITNGISLKRWINPELLKLYEENGAIDQFELPSLDYRERIAALSSGKLRELKDEARRVLREDLLYNRLDQYGRPINIPENAKIFGWARRIASYKRPDLILDKPEALAQILERENIHILMAGKAHPRDVIMQDAMRTGIFEVIDRNPILRKRVHFVQNYNEDVSTPMVRGADAWINTPIVGEEADGTSKDKAIANNGIVISTSDGGMHDPSIKMQKGVEVIPGDKPPFFLEITGRNRDEEVGSLYSNLVRASKIVDEQDLEYSWADFVKRQLMAYLPSFSGGRMASDYLGLAFPKEKSSRHLPMTGDVYFAPGQ